MRIGLLRTTLFLALGFTTLVGCGSRARSRSAGRYGHGRDDSHGSLCRGTGQEEAATARATSRRGSQRSRARSDSKVRHRPPPPCRLPRTRRCAHPEARRSTTATLSSIPASQGLANVLLYVDKCPTEWIHPDAQPGKTGDIIFDQKECVFLDAYGGHADIRSPCGFLTATPSVTT